jgi:hypothetical protein
MTKEPKTSDPQLKVKKNQAIGFRGQYGFRTIYVAFDHSKK